VRIYLVDNRNPFDPHCYNFGLNPHEDEAVHGQLEEMVQELEEPQVYHVHNVSNPIDKDCPLVWDGNILKRTAWSEYESADDSNPEEPNVNDGDETCREVTSDMVWACLRRNMNRASHRIEQGAAVDINANFFITLAALRNDPQ
jgi:hypothetical protein